MTLITAAKNCLQNILIWLSGRAVKTQLQIVLIRLFAATDGYPVSVKNELKKIFFSIFFYFLKVHFNWISIHRRKWPN